ncbi:hypothetical protein MHYP_G00196950 [Metynnis hypsauchen]
MTGNPRHQQQQISSSLRLKSKEDGNSSQCGGTRRGETCAECRAAASCSHSFKPASAAAAGPSAAPSDPHHRSENDPLGDQQHSEV